MDKIEMEGLNDSDIHNHKKVPLGLLSFFAPAVILNA